MITRIHPLSGAPMNGKPANGKPRQDVLQALAVAGRRAVMSFDAARPGSDLDEHFKFADSLDPDSAYSPQVRRTLIKRSRYEQGSNGIYDGIVSTHCNLLMGTGPTLRMLTGSRNFNQLVEREFYNWMQQTHLRRKLWAMCHGRYGDGETLAILQDNPALPSVTLDVLPIEAEQCHTPYGEVAEAGRVDGIYFDEFNNVVAYDVLPEHPGSQWQTLTMKAIRVSAANMLHWFKLKRAGAHRGIPEGTSSLPVGATSRRHREATVAAAETAASIAALIYSKLNPNADDERYPLIPMTEVPMPKRALVALPDGWEANQMKGEHPNAEYGTFHRLQVSETARPFHMPVNLAMCDSSTYSFASGKLDTLGYRAALDVERQDCSDTVLDPIFAAWFREWTIVESRRDIPPTHEWVWPKHPVIDEVADASAVATNLSTGRTTLRQVCSADGYDYEDQLAIQAEDIFGEASEENIVKCRHINALKNTPSHAINHVAALLGIAAPASSPPPTPDFAPAAELTALRNRVLSLESHQR